MKSPWFTTREKEETRNMLGKNPIMQRGSYFVEGRASFGESGGVGPIVLILIVSFNMIFFSMLYLTGAMTLDDAKQVLGFKPSDLEVISSMREASLTDERLVIEAERIVRERRLLEKEKREMNLLLGRIEVEKKSLKRLRDEVDELKASYEKAIMDEKEKDLAKLVKIFEIMKPEEIAGILLNFEEDTVIAILVRLKERKTAKILSLMGPDYAARISRKMGSYGRKIDPVKRG